MRPPWRPSPRARSRRKNDSAIARLEALDPETGQVNAVVDTSTGSRNKYEYDAEKSLFRLGGVLPAGAVFPFDSGFAPSTQGGGGDPLDILLLVDEPAFVGCLVPARLVGVIEAEQSEEEGAARNDRLIAVAADSHNQGDVRSLDNLNGHLLKEIEHFFISYNAVKGKIFRPLERFGPEWARELVEEGVSRSRSKPSP